MSTKTVVRTARYDYKCDFCGDPIPAGSMYKCVTYHSVSTSLPPKGLYHKRYVNYHHSNSVRRFHCECYSD